MTTMMMMMRHDDDDDDRSDDNQWWSCRLDWVQNSRQPSLNIRALRSTEQKQNGSNIAIHTYIGCVKQPKQEVYGDKGTSYNAKACIKCNVCDIPYSGKFLRDKILADGFKNENLQIKYLRMQAPYWWYMCVYVKIHKYYFADVRLTAKSAQILSCKNFLLYGAFLSHFSSLLQTHLSSWLTLYWATDCKNHVFRRFFGRDQCLWPDSSEAS